MRPYCAAQLSQEQVDNLNKLEINSLVNIANTVIRERMGHDAMGDVISASSRCLLPGPLLQQHVKESEWNVHLLLYGIISKNLWCLRRESISLSTSSYEFWKSNKGKLRQSRHGCSVMRRLRIWYKTMIYTHILYMYNNNDIYRQHDATMKSVEQKQHEQTTLVITSKLIQTRTHKYDIVQTGNASDSRSKSIWLSSRRTCIPWK